MSILTIADAIAQCRLPDDYPADQLQPYIDAAEADACAYLNRATFVDDAALAAAQEAVPASMALAGEAYATAMAAADAMVDVNQQQAARDVAAARLDASTVAAQRIIRGIVVNAAVIAAIRLTMAHLFANREDVMTGQRAAAVSIPNGARDLMRPYRWTATP